MKRISLLKQDNLAFKFPKKIIYSYINEYFLNTSLRSIQSKCEINNLVSSWQMASELNHPVTCNNYALFSHICLTYHS